MKNLKLNDSLLTQSLKLIMLSPFTVLPVAYADDEVKVLKTIVLSSQKDSVYSGSKVAIQGFATDQIQNIPASIAVVTGEVLADQHARVLSDVVKNDASVGDGYAAIGYYPNFISRGFALDLASSYLVNGHVIRGEQNVALENKQRVEILKGTSAIQSGMSTPGGVVNYVTKRPEDIRSLSLATNQHGQYSVAADVGGFWGANQQFGYRINVANEQLNSYVDHVDGNRQFASVALDWKASERSKVEFDFEAQRAAQRSVPAYQLLDGKVPENIKWERLLGHQTWGKDVTINSFNTNLNYEYAFSDAWTLGLGASHSQSVVDDYSNFAWGCYSSVCQYTGLGNSFDANGNYDIYDYQNPDDTFKTSQFKVQLAGQVKGAGALHHLNANLDYLNKKRDRFSSVNELIGVGNIYTDTVDFAPTTVQVGQAYQAINSEQWSLSASDRIEWNSQWSTLVGGKWINLDEKANNKKGQQTRHTEFDKFLPQFAVTYQPLVTTMLYASYAKGLADGRSAAWFADNDGEILAPIHSVQYEIGLKQQINQFLLTAALFDLKQDNQYTKPTETGSFVFVQEGEQHSQGLELGVQGNLTQNLALTSSLALTKARLNNINAVEYRNHQAQNVPKVRASAQLAYAVPQVEGLKVLVAGRYSASKFANKEATAKVDGFALFDLGMSYAFKLNQQDAQLRFNIENILNEKYWRDVGEFDGDNYMFLGTPRTASVSLSFNF